MDSMKARLLTAAIGVPAAVGVLFLGESFNWIMHIIIGVLSPIMVFELLSAKKLHKNPYVVVLCALFSAIQPAMLLLNVGLLPFYIFALLMFLVMIINNSSVSYTDVAFAVLGTLIISWGMTSILILPPLYQNRFSFFFVVCLGIPWFADAGAYFSGVFFGKHKLCPKVSPNKTVEGFVGGIFFGILSSVLIGVVYTFIYKGVSFNYLVLLVIGILSSVVSVLGDLTFSLIKRHCGIKDYGSIFPGHGGFLDRFDSVIVTAPLVYFIGLYFPVFV